LILFIGATRSLQCWSSEKEEQAYYINMFVKDVAISCLLLLGLAHAQQFELTPKEFLAGNQQGMFNVIIDVRTQSEWNEGHIENATLLENLASTGSPELLLGCENCTLAVYCRTGSRAAAAITRLQTVYNFQGEVFNALGVNDWTGAGYPLVVTDSVAPPCNGTQEDTCCKGCDALPEETMPPDEEEMPDDGSILRSLGLGWALIGMFGAVLCW
jgi:rhodanese-related sulfurtransferase